MKQGKAPAARKLAARAVVAKSDLVMRFSIAFVVVLAALAVYVSVSRGRIPVESVPIMRSNHIDDVGEPHEPYNSNPPTSGPHIPYVAKRGFYAPEDATRDGEDRLPYELLVHNLEDGGVVIYYRPDLLAESDLDKLKSLAAKYARAQGAGLVIAPHKGSQPEAVVATAWGKIMRQQALDEAQLDVFIRRFIGIDHHGEGGG